MLKLLKKDLYRDMRNKGMLIFLVASTILCFSFWGGTGELNLYNSTKRIKNASPEEYAMLYLAYNWKPSTDDSEEAYTEFVNYMESMKPTYLRAAVSRMFTENSPALFVGIYAAAYFIAANFSGRNVGIDVSAGYSRRSVFVATLLRYYLFVTITLIFVFFAFLFYAFGFRWITALQPYHWRSFCIWLYLSLSMVSLPFFIAFLFRRVLKTLVVSIILVVGVPFLPQSAYYGAEKYTGLIGTETFDWLPMAMCKRTVLYNEQLILNNYESLMFIVVPLTFLVGASLLAYLFFRRAELK